LADVLLLEAISIGRTVGRVVLRVVVESSG
jgi:hypothetical protein